MSNIDIYFDPETGEIKIDVEGAGGDCVDLTKALEELLGLDDVTTRKLKAEYYEGGDGKKRTESIRERLISHPILEQFYYRSVEI